MESLREQFDSAKRDNAASGFGAALDRVFGRAFQLLIGLVVVLFYCYILYFILNWLAFGPGTIVLIFALFAGIVYVIFEWLPKWMSKRSGRNTWECQCAVNTYLFLGAAIVLGAYYVPKEFGLNIPWYWRILLGIGVALLGNVTRRY